jgi:hypothetical protein
MTLDDFRKSLTATEPPAGINTRSCRTVVGCQGRLDTSPRIGSLPRLLLEIGSNVNNRSCFDLHV